MTATRHEPLLCVDQRFAVSSCAGLRSLPHGTPCVPIPTQRMRSADSMKWRRFSSLSWGLGFLDRIPETTASICNLQRTYLLPQKKRLHELDFRGKLGKCHQRACTFDSRMFPDTILLGFAYSRWWRAPGFPVRSATPYFAARFFFISVLLLVTGHVSISTSKRRRGDQLYGAESTDRKRRKTQLLPFQHALTHTRTHTHTHARAHTHTQCHGIKE